MSKREKGYLLIVIVAVIMSTPEVALKAFTGIFAPMQLCCERVLVGAIAILPLALRDLKARGIKMEGHDYLRFLGLGFLMVPMQMALQQLAICHIDASAVATIFCGNPITTMILAHLILHEPMRRNNIAALCFQFLGIVLIVNPFSVELETRGFLEILVSTCVYSVLTTYSKPTVTKFGSICVGCFNLLFGGLELLFLLLLGHIPAIAALYTRMGLEICANVPFFAGFSARTILPFLYVACLCAGYGYVLIVKVIEYTSATESSFIYLVKPILSCCLASFALHEVISPSRMASVACSTVASLCITVPLLRERKKARTDSE